MDLGEKHIRGLQINGRGEKPRPMCEKSHWMETLCYNIEGPWEEFGT